MPYSPEEHPQRGRERSVSPAAPLEGSSLPAPPAARRDVYSRITDQILGDLEKGVRPWAKSWSAEHAAGPVSRPLRHDGQPYRGINVVMLWMSAVSRGFAAPLWVTFRQCREL